jgi:hypothetical protein
MRDCAEAERRERKELDHVSYGAAENLLHQRVMAHLVCLCLSKEWIGNYQLPEYNKARQKKNTARKRN